MRGRGSAGTKLKLLESYFLMVFDPQKDLRSMPPMYFIVISQWPQTAETVRYSFLPRRPRKAGPKYTLSTT